MVPPCVLISVHLWLHRTLAFWIPSWGSCPSSGLWQRADMQPRSAGRGWQKRGKLLFFFFFCLHTLMQPPQQVRSWCGYDITSNYRYGQPSESMGTWINTQFHLILESAITEQQGAGLVTANVYSDFTAKVHFLKILKTTLLRGTWKLLKL